MKNIVLSLTALLIIVTFYSCTNRKMASGKTANSSAMLYDHKWYLTELQGKPFTYEGVNNNFAHLLFSAGNPVKISGFTGCNRLMGTANIAGGNTMQFAPLATTKMACPGSDIETSFLNALKTVNNYKITDTLLVLNNGSEIVATFNGISMEMDKLSGTWQLNYLSGTRIAFDGLYPDKKPFIYFNFPAGVIGGNTTCNGFSAQYTIKKDSIHFADPLKTMMFCEGGGEEAFLNMLKKVNKYTLNDTTLTFLMNNVAVMRFAKQ